MYLVDNNVVSELRKPRPNSHVVQWLESVDDKDFARFKVRVLNPFKS